MARKALELALVVSPPATVRRTMTEALVLFLAEKFLGLVVEHHLSRFVEGQDPRNVELMWDQMFRATLPYGRKGVAIHAISAVDLVRPFCLPCCSHLLILPFPPGNMGYSRKASQGTCLQSDWWQDQTTCSFFFKNCLAEGQLTENLSLCL